MSAQRILLTGATGIVGCEIVRAYLRQPEPPEILAIVRGSAEEAEAKRRWLCSWSGVAAPRDSRLVVLRGDMTLPGLGLAEADFALARSATGILHSGAVTRFDQAAEVAFTNNVVSVRRVLEHARACPRLDRIGLVGTAFVAGRRGGTIFEDELDLAAPFNNEYERSKALAEHEARAAMAGLPIAVYRLGIVGGRATDGWISRLSGVYPVLRLFHQGLLAMFPGEDDQCLDLVPADFAAAAIRHLFSGAFVAGATYHVCAGRQRTFTLGNLFPGVDAFLAAADPAWRGRGQVLPLPVSVDVFRDFIRIVELTGDPRLRQIVARVESVTRQLEVPKAFDTARFDEALRGAADLVLPHARDWLGPSIARAVATGWQQPSKAVA
jgi:nucleoside-diphosphate-sugar epimerase